MSEQGHEYIPGIGQEYSKIKTEVSKPSEPEKVFAVIDEKQQTTPEFAPELSEEQRLIQEAKEKQQQEFEALTHKRIREIRSWDEGTYGIPMALQEYAEKLGIDFWSEKYSFYSDDRRKYLALAPKMIGAYLFEAENNPEDKYGLKYPFEHMSVLEVGGYNDDYSEWASANAFARDMDYTGIDVNSELAGKTQSEKGKKGYIEPRTGKLFECLDLSVLDVDKELADRKYELIFGMGFLGAPTYFISKEIGKTTADTETLILTKLKNILRDGGCMFFLTREVTDLSEEDLKKLGFEVAKSELLTEELLVLRKLPAAEIGIGNLN